MSRDNVAFMKKVPLVTTILIFIGISFLPTVIHQKYQSVIHYFYVVALASSLFLKSRRPLSREDVSLLLFVALSAINIFFARHLLVALEAYLNIALPLLCIYYLISAFIDFKKGIDVLVKTVCIASIIVGGLAIIEFFSGKNPIYEYLLPNEMFNHYIKPFGRPLSTQGNPAVLGTYMLGVLSFHLVLKTTGQKWWRIVGSVGVIICVVVIIQTFSRGVFLGFFGMMVAYWLLQRDYRSLIKFLVAIALLIMISSFLPADFNRLSPSGLFSNDLRGVLSSYRIERCSMTYRMLKDHPVSGIGLNHFRIHFNDYYSGKERNTFEFMIADNMYLTLAAETGMLGFFGFFIFIYAVFRQASQAAIAFASAAKERLTLITLVAGLIGILVNMGAYELFYWPNQYILFCILIACIVGFSWSAKTKQKRV